MRRTVVGLMAAATLLAGGLGAQQRKPQEVELQAAIRTETVDGDLTRAIAQYRAIVTKYPADRPVVAQALVRMAESYEKLGDAQAREIYQRVIREYSDQSGSVTVARTRLAVARPDTSTPAVTLRSVPRSDGLAGTVSADGRYLSYTSWTDGELYVRDLQTGTDRALTQRGDFAIGLSSISKDGTAVAYQSYGWGCDGKNAAGSPALCLVALTVSAPQQTPRVVFESPEILEIAPMDWSPDGRTVAVTLRRQDRTAQIGLVTVAERSIRVLQSVDWRGPTRVFFSPDGRDIAFDLPVSDATDERDIFMLAADASRRVSVVEHPSQDVVMGWGPDGSSLLFASDRGGTMGLWAQPFADRRPAGAPRLIRSGLAGAWSVGITRSGALYFGVTNSERDISLATIDLATGTQQGASTRPIRRFFGANSMPEWSADGKSLAYVSQRGFNPTSNGGRIIGIRDLSTGEERELRPQLTYFGPISWAPNGSAFLTAGTDLKGREGVFSVDARSGEASLVVEGTTNGYPQWSPDGTRLFYRKGADGQFKDWTIVERELASGMERSIARGELGVFSVSPDGRSIAAPMGGIAGAAAPAIVEIRVDTGATRDLLRVPSNERFPPYVAPQWTPDGKAVLVRKRTPSEMWLVPADGTPARKLDVDVRDWLLGAVGQISVHPDGRRIAFLSGNTTNEVIVLENFLPAPTAKK